MSFKFSKFFFAGTLFLAIAGHGLTSYAITDTTTKEPQVPLATLKPELGILNQQDLTAITSDILATYGDNLTDEQLNAYIPAQAKLIESLRDFKVTGIGVSGVSLDPNYAFIYNNQNPVFDIYFKNATGEIKQRTYQTSIKSVGIKAECAFNLHLLFFINSDLNFFDANTVIPLSWGGEVSIPWHLNLFHEKDAETVPVHVAHVRCNAYDYESGRQDYDEYSAPQERKSFTKIKDFIKKYTKKDIVDSPISSLIALSFTYASIKNNGGLLMATLGFGLKYNFASVVIGGSLKPIEKPATNKSSQK